VASELFHSSYQRFDGDITAINRNPGANINMIPFAQGIFVTWRPRAKKILLKEFNSIFTYPILNMFVFVTPAHGTYAWHREGTQNLHRLPGETQEYIQLNNVRRNCAINYNLNDSDLSKSKLYWGKASKEANDLINDNYHNVYPDKGFLHVENKVGLAVGFESVLDQNLIRKTDEYVGLDVPVLIKTDDFHMIDNTECEHDRIAGTVSFGPNMMFDGIKNMITNMAK